MCYSILFNILVCDTGDEHKELMRKDIVDLKRAMNDEIHEKEATQKAANDLRNMVKKAEAEKIELNRSLQDAGQKIAGLWRHLLPPAHGAVFVFDTPTSCASSVKVYMC